ncbi:MAG: hypothetical protein IJ583_01375 [Firmicutes bacterium]|nr:hypothetical protein [Bacillota bacterium]
MRQIGFLKERGISEVEEIGLSFQEWDMISKYTYTKSISFIHNKGFILNFSPQNRLCGVYAVLWAVRKFIEKNDGVRVIINKQKENSVLYVQHINTSPSFLEIPVVAFKDKEKEYRQYLLKCYMEEFKREEKIYRFNIIVFENGEYNLLAVFDHLNMDQYALSIASSSIKRLHDAIIEGKEPIYEPPSFKDYVKRQLEYLSSKRYKRDIDFWNNYLDKDSRYLNYGKSLKVIGEDKPFFETYSDYLKNDKMERLRELSKRFSVSVDTLFFSFFALLGSRYLNIEQFFIVRRYENRLHNEDKELFACCRAELPVLVNIDEEKSFAAFCEENFRESTVVQRHGAVPVLDLERIYKKYSGAKSDKISGLRFGIGQDGFTDVRDIIMRYGEANIADDSVKKNIQIDYTILGGIDIIISKNRDGCAVLTISGKKDFFEGLKSFEMLESEMMALAERLYEEGDMTIAELMGKIRI